MILVYGTIQNRIHDEEKLNFEVKLNVDGITEDHMEIHQSTKLIIDAINKKYQTSYNYKSLINPLHIKE